MSADFQPATRWWRDGAGQRRRGIATAAARAALFIKAQWPNALVTMATDAARCLQPNRRRGRRSGNMPSPEAQPPARSACPACGSTCSAPSCWMVASADAAKSRRFCCTRSGDDDASRLPLGGRNCGDATASKQPRWRAAQLHQRGRRRASAVTAPPGTAPVAPAPTPFCAASGSAGNP